MFNAVCTSSVSRIHSRKVRRLDAASAQIAIAQYAVAVRPRYPLAPPRAHRRVTIPQPGFAPSQELVSQLEVEIVSHTLETTRLSVAVLMLMDFLR